MTDTCALIGRKGELEALQKRLSDASMGKGSFTLLTGEAGMGKSSIVASLIEKARKNGMLVLSGHATSDSSKPYKVFIEALGGHSDISIFSDEEVTGFDIVMALGPSGMIASSAGTSGAVPPSDISDMLTVVEGFVRDSFSHGSTSKQGLGKLEYGDMKLIIEQGNRISVAAVIRGREHQDMRSHIRDFIRRFDTQGAYDSEPARRLLEAHLNNLANTRFSVKKDLEGIKLDNERLKIAGKVAASLGLLSGERAVLLVLEDLHWADESSGSILRFIARNAQLSRLSIVGTSRPGYSEKFDANVKYMLEEGVSEEIRLEGMSVEESLGLIDTIYGNNDFGEEFGRELHATCAGNPFFLKEILRHMLAEGNIVSSGDSFRLEKRDYVLPTTVEEAVRRMLDTLKVNSMTMAEFASCAGKIFDARILSESRIPEAMKAIDELVASGIFSRNEGRIEFSHALYKDIIYAGLSSRWKTLHHREIAGTLERTYIDNIDEIRYELAHHFMMGQQYEKALTHCLAAGEKAENAFAAEQAARFYKDALKALCKLRKDPDMSFMISERIGDALALAGSFDEARAQFEKLGTMVSNPESIARSRRKLGAVYEKLGDYQKTLETATDGMKMIGSEHIEHWRLVLTTADANMRMGNFQSAIEACGNALAFFGQNDEHLKDRAHAYGTLGICYWYTGELDRALLMFNECMSVKTEIGDRLGQAQCYNNIGLVHRTRGDLDMARIHLEKGLAIVNELGYQYGISMLTTNLAIMLYDMGNLELALGLHKKGLAINESIGDRGGIASSYANIGVIYLDMGEYATALDYYANSTKIKKMINDRSGMASNYMNIGSILQMQGDIGGALDAFSTSLEIREQINDQIGITNVQINIAIAKLSIGKTDDAEQLFTKALGACRNLGNKDMIIKSLLGLVEVGIIRGKSEDMLPLLDEASETAEKSKMPVHIAYCRRTKGLLSRALGNPEDAIGFFIESAEIFRKITMQGENAVSLLEVGITQAASDRIEEARVSLTASLQVFEAKGMRGYADLARETLIALSAR